MKSPALHPWIHPIAIAYLPGSLTPALERSATALLGWLQYAGCTVTAEPTNSTDLIITTTQFGRLTDRDEALLFHAKRKYRLGRRPHVLTLVDVPEADYQQWIAHFGSFARSAGQGAPVRRYAGLGPQAAEVIAVQIQRGGPELAFSRLVQAQVLSIRVMAIRTVDGRPYRAIHFDLAGARPVTDATEAETFAADAGPRVLAALCAEDANHHVFLDNPVPAVVWQALRGPDAMVRAGSLFTEYGFFTEPIYIEKLLGYRGISEAISAQYSEGCYAVYEADLPGLITTATGSSRLVDKRSITRMDQAVVVGLNPERDGALVRPVTGMEPVVPSVEAVEMMSICQGVESHNRSNSSGAMVSVPNVRALLHGHLGVAAYNPELVESVTLDPLYYSQLVSCGTGALANGTAVAFARSASLRDLNDPRQLVFLEQPGHGVMLAEKWPGSGLGPAPFETIRQFLAEGHLQMSFDVPQGFVQWEAGRNARHEPVMRKSVEPEPLYPALSR